MSTQEIHVHEAESAQPRANLYGMVAEFDHADDLLHAAQQTYAAGYRKIDAYSPFPIHGMPEAIGFKEGRVGLITFLGGVLGALTGAGLQIYTTVIDYPMNVGGRPLMSIPSFFPATYELTILFASFGAAFGMLALNGLPRPHHPIFNAPNFDKASQNKFFLCIEAADPKFDRVETRRYLEGLHPTAVSDVEK